MLKQQSYKDKNYKEALKDTFYALDTEMLDNKSELFKLTGNDYNEADYISTAGCTATVVLITKDQIICANSGDSRTVLCRGKEAVALSEDHKPQNMEEKDRIEAAGGFVADNRVDGNLALSRALGDFEYKSNSAMPREK